MNQQQIGFFWRVSLNHALALLLIGSLIGGGPSQASTSGNISVEIVVHGRSLSEYQHHGTTYIEAIKGANYTIRLTNHSAVRVAVALAVDGRNTIDGARSSAANARKWVLSPYQSIDIPGWQTSTNDARKFVFSTEDRSYAAALGDASGAGVIEAVAYREVQQRVTQNDRQPWWWPHRDGERVDHDNERSRAPRSSDAAGAAAPSPTMRESSAETKSHSHDAELSDDYAATGMGRRTNNNVVEVAFEAEASPSAHIRLRYGYHDELVELGVLPNDDPLVRREQASGFLGFCPVPNP